MAKSQKAEAVLPENPASVATGQDTQPDTATVAAFAADTSQPALAAPEAPVGSALVLREDGRSVEGPELTVLDDAIPALWIRSVPPTFRRCGFAFTREGIGIALSALDEDQVERLVNEPNLVVEHSWFTDRVQE